LKTLGLNNKFYTKCTNCQIELFCKFWYVGWLCDLQMCLMCVAYPNCPSGQKRVGKTKSFQSKQVGFFIS